MGNCARRFWVMLLVALVSFRQSAHHPHPARLQRQHRAPAHLAPSDAAVTSVFPRHQEAFRWRRATPSVVMGLSSVSMINALQLRVVSPKTAALLFVDHSLFDLFSWLLSTFPCFLFPQWKQSDQFLGIRKL